MSSWAQQREAIRRAAQGGVRARTNAQGSQRLPLANNRLREVLLSRPNGELTRAGQFYYGLVGGRPPSRQFDEEQPLIRETPTDYILLRSGVKKAVRSLQPDGSYHLTKLGKSFFREKYTDWLAHVPVRITGTRQRGRNAGRPYQRDDFLPITVVNGSLSRQSSGLSDQQAHARVKEAALRQLDSPNDGDPIMELSQEVYRYDATRDWAFSKQTLEVVDNRAQVQVALRQPMGALREISYQLYNGSEILPSAFEARNDKLCVARQLAELLPTSTPSATRAGKSGASPPWRSGSSAPGAAPPCSSSAAAASSWTPTSLRSRRTGPWPSRATRRTRTSTGRPGRSPTTTTPRATRASTAATGRKPRCRPSPSGAPGPAADLRSVRAALLAQGHQPKVTMRSLCDWRALRLHVRDAPDCVVTQYAEDAEILQAWMQKLGLEYRGQRLAGAAAEAFQHLLKAKRLDPRGSRDRILEEQNYQCKLCSAPIELGCCEFDHVVPVHQALEGQPQVLQALCLECHRTKTLLESSRAACLESRVCRSVHEAYVQSPRPPALVCKLAKCDPDRICHGVDVVRCRKNALANATFPRPSSAPWTPWSPPGRAPGGPHLRGAAPGRPAGPAPEAPLPASPRPRTCWRRARRPGPTSSGPWTPRRVEPRCLAQALEVMEDAWPEGEEHKLSVNALIGLWARNQDLVYSMRTSNHELDGQGCQWRQTFTDAAGKVHWDHINATELFSNYTLRPLHDYVMAQEHVAVAKIRDHLRKVPPRYVVALKTDCLVFQDLPKKFLPAVRELTARKHQDGTPVYRFEECKRLEGEYREPRIEAPYLTCYGPEWRSVEDPLLHCLNGKSLLLSGMPGTGKTHLARQIVAQLCELGEVVKLVSKTHCSVQNLGAGAQTADRFVRRSIRDGSCELDRLVIEEITQLDSSLWADIAELSLNPKVKFLLLGDFRQLPAVLDAFGGAPVTKPLRDSRLLHDLAGGCYHELTENHRSDEAIFGFLRYLRVDEAEEPPLREALQLARSASRNGGSRTPAWSSATPTGCASTSSKRRLAPAEAVTLRYEGRAAAGTNAPQTMRVWPGLRLVGAGGKVAKGCFVAVTEAGPGAVRLDTGERFTHAELLRHTRLCHAITNASCQGLTLQGRVHLCDTSSPHFELRHLYVGASRATSAELLSVL